MSSTISRPQPTNVFCTNWNATPSSITPKFGKLCAHPLQSLNLTPFSIDYFGDHSRLVITIPGLGHETVAADGQYSLRQSLFDQGFYWPGWGGSIKSIEFTGSADRTFPGPGKSTVLQPDGSLQISGQNLPFLVIEVADTESYRHARTKARNFLMGSKGKIRFVILIDLMRKTPNEMVNTPLVKAEPGSDEPNAPEESSRTQPFLEGNKRAAQDNDDDNESPEITKRARTASPAPQSPILPVVLPPAPYSRATVTVFTTSVIDHPKLTAKRLRTMDTLIDAAECWPSMPAQDVCFTFSWDDMNVKDYPVELRNCKFTVRFEWLHETMERKFGLFQGFPTMQDDSSDMVYESDTEPDSEEERERLWAVEEKVDSGKVESDDSWKSG